MTETIPENKEEFLNQLSQIHGIPVQDLTKYYEKQLNNPELSENPSFKGNPQKLMEYIDDLITGFIQEFHASVLEEFEVFIAVSSNPFTTKTGSLMSNHIALAKRANNNGEKAKFLSITNFEDSAILNRIPPLSTGTIKVSISNENEQTIESFSRTNSEFNQRDLTWIPHTDVEKKAYLFELIKPTDINQAKNKLSAKTEDGKRTSPFSLRRITATVSSRRRTKSVDEVTKKERESLILNLVDKSVQMNSEFFKKKTIPDPKDPKKAITQYGGFAAFCDVADDGLDKGSQADFIGYITSSTTMNAVSVFPTVVIAPKKPTERLQKPNTPPAQKSGIDPAAI